ncbi:MAG: hypothetical protein LAN70_12360 [Acidobacteriia bacterium]|nr:hypothetical protein [Terriglobia bacterium]
MIIVKRFLEIDNQQSAIGNAFPFQFVRSAFIRANPRLGSSSDAAPHLLEIDNRQ